MVRTILRKSLLPVLAVAAAARCWGPGPAVAGAAGEWVTLAPMNMARQEVGAARLGDVVYVVGGLIAGFNATATVEVYDIAADQWSFVASLPVGLHHMAVAVLDGKLYAMGGYQGSSFVARNEVRIYDPGANMWSNGPSLPSARGACWAVAHQGKIYLFGGRDAAGASSTTTFVFDPAENGWTTGQPMPTAREHLTAVSLGDFIYVVGGRNGASVDVNERYDPATDTWETLAPMPTARSATATAAFDGKLHVAGGEVPMLFDVHEVYDPVTDQWEMSTPMAIPRHGIAAVTLDDRILTPAGGVVQGLAPTNAVDSFVPAQPAPVPAVSSSGRALLGLVVGAVGAAIAGRIRMRAPNSSFGCNEIGNDPHDEPRLF